MDPLVAPVRCIRHPAANHSLLKRGGSRRSNVPSFSDGYAGVAAALWVRIARVARHPPATRGANVLARINSLLHGETTQRRQPPHDLHSSSERCRCESAEHRMAE